MIFEGKVLEEEYLRLLSNHFLIRHLKVELITCGFEGVEGKKKILKNPKTNIAPENRPSQRETCIPTINFQLRTVSFREGKRS